MTNLPASSVQGNQCNFEWPGGIDWQRDANHRFLLRVTADGGTNLSAWSNSVVLGLQTGSFNYAAIDLSTNKTYYYAVAATNSAGNAWATPSQSFTTLAANPANIPTTQNQYLSGTDKDHTVPVAILHDRRWAQQ